MIWKVIAGTVITICVLGIFVCLAMAAWIDDETWDDDKGKGE